MGDGATGSAGISTPGKEEVMRGNIRRKKQIAGTCKKKGEILAAIKEVLPSRGKVPRGWGNRGTGLKRKKSFSNVKNIIPVPPERKIHNRGREERRIRKEVIHMRNVQGPTRKRVCAKKKRKIVFGKRGGGGNGTWGHAEEDWGFPYMSKKDNPLL